MIYSALILVIMSFTFEQTFASQNHFKNQLLGKCPETELSFTTADNLRVLEGSGAVNLGVSLTKTACADMQVEYGNYMTSGTVVGGHVSAGVSGSVTIPKGQKTATISFSILQNAVSETEKSVFIFLRGGKDTRQKVALGANVAKGISIADDESTHGNITKLATASDTNCIIIAGVLKCWGDNSVGSVGSGDVVNREEPYTVSAGTSFTTVAMGAGGAVCAVTTAGTLRCWGSNFGNVLGDGSASSYRTSPVTIDSGTSYTQVSVGHNHGCGITTTNVLKCWGATNNNVGQLGDGSTTSGTTTPKVINAGTSYTVVSAYGFNGGATGHTCAITTSGELQCWGKNSSGQVGNNTLTNQLLPVTIDAGVSYTQVVTGGEHACGITSSGVLKCWGDNAKGQLGDGTTTDKIVPTEIDSGQTYLDISLGDNYTCGITTANKLKCWGDNTYYNLGNGTKLNATLPVAIDNSENYKVVAVGGGALTNSVRAAACALTTSGRLKCWGNNNGHFILGATSSFNDIRDVNQDIKFDSVSVGKGSACGINVNQKLYCWGSNLNGEIGDRRTLARDSAVIVDAKENYAMVSVSSDSTMTAPYPHACGITTSGVLKCWGSNQLSKLGDGTTVQKIKPKVIDSGTTYSYVSSGYYNTCAITTSGVLKCWGDNSKGQLGIGSTISKNLPTVVASGTAYSAVMTSARYDNGNHHTCAITAAGQMQCWGSNHQGQLGNGTTSTTPSTSPVPIDTGETYSAVSIGSGFLRGFTCGLTTGKKIKCWGDNGAGALGVGDTSPRTSPTPVDALTDYKKISLKGEISCAVTDAGRLRCWGYNFYKMVGDGTTTNRTSPVDIDASRTYADVNLGSEAGSRSANCAIEAVTGRLRCWGFNYNGTILDGPTIITAPMAIPKASQLP